MIPKIITAMAFFVVVFFHFGEVTFSIGQAKYISHLPEKLNVMPWCMEFGTEGSLTPDYYSKEL